MYSPARPSAAAAVRVLIAALACLATAFAGGLAGAADRDRGPVSPEKIQRAIEKARDLSLIHI